MLASLRATDTEDSARTCHLSHLSVSAGYAGFVRVGEAGYVRVGEAGYVRVAEAGYVRVGEGGWCQSVLV